MKLQTGVINRRHLGYLAFAFAMFWLETGLRLVFPEARFFIPNLVLAAAAVFISQAGFRATLFALFFLGLLGELYSGLTFGAVIFSLVIFAAVADFAARSPSARALSLASPPLWLFIGVLIFPLSAYLFHLAAQPFGGSPAPGLRDYYSWKIAWQAAISSLLYFPAAKLFKTAFHE